MLAVGGQYLDEQKLDRARVNAGNPVTAAARMATGFSGGLGDTREELCGALSGGVMIIGALFGRASLEEDDQLSINLAARYRSRFLEMFGYTECRELRREAVDAPGGLDSCAELVERAVSILVGLLDEATSAVLAADGEG